VVSRRQLTEFFYKLPFAFYRNWNIRSRISCV